MARARGVAKCLRNIAAVLLLAGSGSGGPAFAADYAEVTRSVRAGYEATIRDMTAKLGTPDASDAERERYLRERGVARSNLDLNEEAIRDFTEAIDIAPTEVSHYIDRAFTYEKLGRDAEANNDLEFALGLKSSDFWAYRGKGSLAMKRGAFDEAATFFGRGLHSAKGEETLYGVIWTAMALGRAGREDWKTLSANVLSRVQTRAWPIPVLQLYAGKITQEALIEATASSNARTERDQLCEAWYYAGELQMILGNTDKAREAFRASVATGVGEFVEHVWAVRALAALDGASK